MRISTPVVAVVVAATVAMSAAPAATAAPGDPRDPLRLSVPMHEEGDADFVVSPDGQWVVTRADVTENGIEELHAVPAAGGVPIPLGIGRKFFTRPQITADSQYVVFRSAPPPSVDDEIVAVPISGGAEVVLSDDETAALRALSPDGTTALISRAVTDDVHELLAVEVATGASTLVFTGGRLSGPVEVSPDGTTVVFRARNPLDEGLDRGLLYAVPIVGGGETVLNRAWPGVGAVELLFQITPDSTRVVYQAEQDAQGVHELYSVPIAGGAVVRLNRSLPEKGDVREWLVTPDGARVVYVADQRTNNVREVFSVPVDGGVRTRLSGAMVAGGDAHAIAVTPDSTTVVYLADQERNGTRELFASDIATGSWRALSGDLVAGGDVRAFTMSPVDGVVGYVADARTNNVRELFVVDVDTSDVTRVSRTMGPGGDVDRHNAPTFTPDGTTLVYRADARTNTVWELWAVPRAGGGSTRLTGTFPDGGDVKYWTALDDRAVFQADQLVNNQREIFTTTLS